MSEIIQQTEWGYIRRYNNDSLSGRRSVSYATEVILPGKQDAEHVHYAEKQFIYVIRGNGEHTVNGSVISCREGDTLFIPLGAVHSVRNTGAAVLEQLVAAEAVQLIPSTLPEEPEPEGEPMKPDFIRSTLLTATRRLTAETLDHLNMAVVITDMEQQVIYRGHTQGRCIGCTEEHCPLIGYVALPEQSFDGHGITMLCPKELSVMIMPVTAGGQIVAFIKGGLFRKNQRVFQNAPSGVNEMSSSYGFTNLFMQDMCTYFRDYFRDCRMAQELSQSRQKMEKEELYTQSVLTAYEQTRDIALNLQVRNHFLFNALNSVASLAIEDGSIETYKAILDLSDLFRGLLRKEGTRVPLREELEFLGKYMHLQQLRHENSLKVIWDTSKEADPVIVPHHFLQIIVENSFVHAFKGKTGIKRILIKTVIANQYIKIIIGDNGCGMSQKKLAELKESLYENSTHGLAMVFRKFSGIYGTDFKFEVDSLEGRGTIYQISLPI